LSQIKKLVFSVAGMGYIRYGPGTVGTLAAALGWGMLRPSLVCQLSTMVFVFLLGLWSIPFAIELSAKKDPQCVVIDEVLGYCVAMAGIPGSWINILSAFVLFRVFDIFKPPPCRRLETISGPWGVLMDDVMAGIYTNISMQLLVRFVF